jgi:hypothetical protein
MPVRMILPTNGADCCGAFFSGLAHDLMLLSFPVLRAVALVPVPLADAFAFCRCYDSGAMVLFWFFLTWLLLIPMAGIYAATLISTLFIGVLLLRNRLREWQEANCISLKECAVSLGTILCVGSAAVVCTGLVVIAIWSVGGPLALAGAVIVPFLALRYSKTGRKVVRVIGKGF